MLVKNPDGQLDVVPVVDSIGTGQMPAGGAATGLGGLAHPASSDGDVEVPRNAVIGIGVLAALGIGVTLTRRRRLADPPT